MVVSNDSNPTKALSQSSMIIPPSTKGSMFTPILSPGLSIWNGQIFEEYLTQLRSWQTQAKIYKEMGDDAVIGSMMEGIYAPLLATPFGIETVDDSDEQKRAKDFLHKNLFEIPGQEWLEHVEDSMDFLAYGFSIAEKVIEKQKDGKLHIRALIPVGQETLLRWGDRDIYGDVTGFIQLDPATSRTATVSMDKLLHFTWRTRKKNPMGRSLFRSLWRPWYFKKNLETLEAIGIERDIGNVPMATLTEDFYVGSPEEVTARHDALKDALDHFRMDETSYIILPRGVELKAYASGQKAYDIRLTIRDWQHLMRQRFFADFLSMGSEQVGTQSLAKELNTFFKLALVSVQRRMTEVWNRQLVPWIFEINNMPMEDYPKIVWNDPSSVNIQSLAQAYAELVNTQLITPTPQIKRHILEQLRLPIDEESLEVATREIVDNEPQPGDNEQEREGNGNPREPVRPVGRPRGT